MRKTVFIILLLGLGLFAVEGSQNLDDYKDETPELNPQKFYNGVLQSYGVIHDYRGRAIKRFHMVMTAKWHGDQASLHEEFLFSSGERKTRDWTITKLDESHYIGTAPDVEGEAKGEARGSALHWIYYIKVPIAGEERVLEFDDWLNLVDENNMFSFVKIKKFGLPVGDMVMFFKK